MSSEELLAKNQSKLLEFIKKVKATNLPLFKKQSLIKTKITNYIKIKDHLYTRQPTKSALLIGINYRGTSKELDGCINDVNNVKKTLINSLGFKDENIVVITDDTIIQPTRVNILNSLTNFIKNSASGDSLFFAYSGHGTHTQTSFNKDELYGQDQLIIPIDANRIQDCILDDDLNAILKTHMKSGVNLFGLMDACYSGTMFDLKYSYMTDNISYTSKYNNFNVTNNPHITSINKGNIFILSGSKDNQKSADATVRDGSKISYTGAMTFTFLNSLEKLGPKTSMQNILTNMRNILIKYNFTQIPQLSSDNFADISVVNLQSFIDNI
jgi:hypothetical protein